MPLLQHKIRAIFDPYMLNMDYTKHIQDHVALENLLSYLHQLPEGKMLGFDFIVPKFLLPPENQRMNIEGIVGMEHGMPRSSMDTNPELPPYPATLNVLREAIDLSAEDNADYIQELKKKESYFFKKIAHKPTANAGFGAVILYKRNGLDILRLAHKYKCNYIVTNNEVLHRYKWELVKYNIYVVTYPDFVKEAAIFVRGFNVFINPYYAVQPLGMTVFYNMTDLRHNSLKALHYRLQYQFKATNKTLSYIEAILYRRYSWLRYASDMTQFYGQQVQLARDPEAGSEYNIALSYHVQQFYFQFSAIIDNLAWMFNHLYDLGYSEATNPDDCKIGSKQFKEKLTEKNASLAAVIYSPKNIELRKRIMNIMRNPSAHQHALMPGVLVDDAGNVIAHDYAYVQTRKGNYMIRGMKYLVKSDETKMLNFLDSIRCYYGA